MILIVNIVLEMDSGGLCVCVCHHQLDATVHCANSRAFQQLLLSIELAYQLTIHFASFRLAARLVLACLLFYVMKHDRAALLHSDAP